MFFFFFFFLTAFIRELFGILGNIISKIPPNPPFFRPAPPNFSAPRPSDRTGWPACRPSDCNTAQESGCASRACHSALHSAPTSLG